MNYDLKKIIQSVYKKFKNMQILCYYMDNSRVKIK